MTAREQADRAQCAAQSSRETERLACEKQDQDVLTVGARGARGAIGAGGAAARRLGDDGEKQQRRRRSAVMSTNKRRKF
jgi:hypothetical protein